MKRLSMLLLTSVFALALSSTAALATPINITIDTAGNLLNAPTGIANNTQYDAIIVGNGNSGANNLVFLNALIGRWNNLYNPDLPAPGLAALYPPSNDNLGGASSYTGPAGYQYVVFHWGNSAGSPGGFYGAYYLGGAAISNLPVPQVGNNTIGGFSSARYFGTVSVPDGGMTLSLLGGALVGLGLLRRKLGA